MIDHNKGKKDRGTKDRHAETDKKSEPTVDGDSGKDEGQLTSAKPKVAEPAGNLRRRAEWFQKRH